MKPIVVQKFGGSSVANPERIKLVAERVVATKRRGCHVVVVVSALGDTTDELITLAEQMTPAPSQREMDMLLSTGEQISVALLAMAIHQRGVDAISFTGAQVGIRTDGFHTKAKIVDINTQRIQQELARNRVVIVAGFQGVNMAQDITTLGRGGSDLTAVALAKVLQADRCEIFTDVKGIYTTDPRVAPQARKLNAISYDEMLEMASAGAQVMQARSIFVAKKFDIPLHVRSSFSKEAGTMITREANAMEDVLVSSVTMNVQEAKMTIRDVPDRPGVAAKIFQALANGGVNVDMIVQNVSRTGHTDMSFTVSKEDLGAASQITKRVAARIGGGAVFQDQDIAKISIVGIGMRSHSGVAAQMFAALAKARINIEMITTSEIKISCIIRKAHAKRAVRLLHRAFGLARRNG